MQNERHKLFIPGRAGAALRCIAITVSSGLLATAMLVLPVGTSGAGLLAGPAFAAGDIDDAARPSGGFGGGPDSISGDGEFASDSAIDDAAATAIAESGDDPVEPVRVPATGRESSTPRVIKEVAGVTGETELSAEEELEAIRNGWGTWRTADGPESVVAQ